MKIAVIGAGHVGQALGAGWAAKGHEVVYGVRDPAGKGGPPGFRSPEDAAAEAQVVALCVMFHQLEQALQDCGDLDGKVVLDPTNPLAPDEGGLKLAVGFDTSSAEFIAARTRGVVVKALNQDGASVLGDTSGYPVRPIQFIAGDDARAKSVVKGLVEDLGSAALDAGPLKAARLLEPLAMVWIDQAMRYGMDPNRAWALVPREH